MIDPHAIAARHAGVFTRPPTATPSNHYPDGPLLGNGDLTAVAAGRADLQSFHLGKSDFWTDGGDWHATNEEYDHYVVSPITVGGLRLWVRDFAQASYRQHQDIAAAELRGTFTLRHHTLRTRSFVAATANLFVLELSCDGPSPLGIHARTFTKASDDPQHATLPTAAGVEHDAAWVTRATWDRGRWVARAALATRVLAAPSTAATDGSTHATAAFLLQPGQAVTVVTALAGGRDATTHRDDALAKVHAATAASLAALRGEHEAWWRDFWARSAVDVGGGVVERFWYGAHYALACCSRPGRTCPGLFGFATDDHPRWNGDFHLNYNAVHPFLAAAAANHADLAEPFIDTINDFIPEGRRRAAVDVTPAMPGVLYPIGLGPWGVAAQDDYMGQKCAAAYAAAVFIDHFDHVRDPDLTRAKLYPFVREVGEFWAAYLRDEGGRLVIRGSVTHEHGGHDVNSNFDLPLVRRVFLALIEMSTLLGVDADLRPRWRDIVARLSPYPTGTHDGRRVFVESQDAPGFTRSLAMFNVVWPGGGDVGAGGDPGLLDVARNTIAAVDLWDQGNCFPWAFNAAARVGLPGLLDRLTAHLRGPQGLRDNLTVAQAYGGIETCGAAHALTQMLLQSYDGVACLFPCWPRDRDAAFTGLRARGGTLLSATQRDGQLQQLEARSDRGGVLRLDTPGWPELQHAPLQPGPDGIAHVTLPPGRRVCLLPAAAAAARPA